MALLLNQVAITSSATLIESVVPNSTVTFSVPTGAATVYVGTSNAVTSSNGFAVNPAGPQVNFTIPPSSQIATIWAITASASVLCIAITSTA